MRTAYVSALAISVDVPPSGEHAAARLLAACNELQLPATWSATHPAYCALIGRAATASVRHEFGLLLDADGERAGRTELARLLTERVQAASEAGIDIRVLSLARPLSQNLDLLVKHQIPVIRSALPVPGQTLRPQSLRFGVWHAPIGQPLPTEQGWGPLQAWRVTRRLRQAERHSQLVHLGIDAARFADGSAAQQNTLLKLLARAGQICAAGRLRPTTLHRLIPQRHTHVAARSILRAA